MGRPKKNMNAVVTGKNQALRKHILERSAELFYKNGYSNVTVDEISKYADISKKTLYDYFLTKYDILNEIVTVLIIDTNKKLSEVVDNSALPFTVKLRESFSVAAIAMSQITLNFMEDLRYKLPDIYYRLAEFKKQAVIRFFSKLIKEGRQNGYITKSINQELAIALFVSSIEHLSDANFFNSLPDKIKNKYPRTTQEIFNEFIHILYYGILSEEQRSKVSIF